MGTRTPLAPPKGVLSSGSPFYFVFLGGGTCLHLWGRRCPVGTVLRRPSRQARRCHAGGVTEGVTSLAVPTPVSPAGSGPAPQWGASRTDRSGNGDRFAAERHRRSLTPLPRLCFLKEEAALAREGGDYSIYLISKGAMVASGDRLSPTEAAAETKLPLWNPPMGEEAEEK